MRNLLFIFVLLLNISLAKGQFKAYGKQMIDSLCAPRYYGRGYVNNGDVKAAEFIERELRKNAISPLNEKYYQEYGFTVNSFPGAMNVSIDGKKLIPGKEFLIEIYSTEINGKFTIVKLGKETLLNEKKLDKLQRSELSNKFVSIDYTEFTKSERKKLLENIFYFKELAKGILLITDSKLTWGSSQFYTTLPVITVNNIDYKGAKTIDVNIENNYQDNHRARNVFGYVPANAKTDSIVVFTAHYDHLGMMGKENIFPGANDNASGTSMLLCLAKHFSLNPTKYNVLCIFFSGEEMGLLGSKYFVENPLIDLKKIKLLINLDLVGTGEEGVTVVNSVSNINVYERLVNINKSKSYLKEVKPRANAENSDHYPFSKKNVPAIFIYALGGTQAYHDIYDKPETLPLTSYDNITKLIIDLVNSKF